MLRPKWSSTQKPLALPWHNRLQCLTRLRWRWVHSHFAIKAICFYGSWANKVTTVTSVITDPSSLRQKRRHCSKESQVPSPKVTTSKWFSSWLPQHSENWRIRAFKMTTKLPKEGRPHHATSPGEEGWFYSVQTWMMMENWVQTYQVGTILLKLLVHLKRFLLPPVSRKLHQELICLLKAGEERADQDFSCPCAVQSFFWKLHRLLRG